MPTDREDYETLRRYLLDGPSGPEEDDRLERRLLADGELAELADAVEEELIEACARGEIPRQRCAALLERLAATPAGRDKLAFYRVLGNVDPVPVPVPIPVPVAAPVSILDWMRQRAPVWRPALAAAALVAVTIGGAWTAHELWTPTTGRKVAVGDKSPAGQGTAGEGNVIPVSPPEEGPAMATMTEIEEPARTEPQAAAEAAPQAPETVVAAKPPAPEARPSAPEPAEAIRSLVALAVSRGHGEELPTVTIGPGRPLEIEVDLDGPENYPKFRVLIVPVSGGEPAWSSGQDDVAVKKGGASLVLRLPAGLLAEGDRYLLKVEGVKEADTEQAEMIGERKFKVVAQ